MCYRKCRAGSGIFQNAKMQNYVIVIFTNGCASFQRLEEKWISGARPARARSSMTGSVFIPDWTSMGARRFFHTSYLTFALNGRRSLTYQTLPLGIGRGGPATAAARRMPVRKLAFRQSHEVTVLGVRSI